MKVANSNLPCLADLAAVHFLCITISINEACKDKRINDLFRTNVRTVRKYHSNDLLQFHPYKSEFWSVLNRHILRVPIRRYIRFGFIISPYASESNLARSYEIRACFHLVPIIFNLNPLNFDQL